MEKSEIIKAIEKSVMGEKHQNYKLWTIGVTADTERRKSEHDRDKKDTRFWEQWKADSERDARDIEGLFQKKGMKGDTGGPGTPLFVYIF